MRSKELDKQRSRVTVQLGSMGSWISLSDLESMIQEAKRRAEIEGIINIGLDISYNRGYYDDIEVSAVLEGSRLETDEEVRLRLDHQHRYSQNEKLRKQRLYEQLKKEFGDA